NDGSMRITDRVNVIANIGAISSFPVDISPVASIILNASVLPDVDDTFTPYYFYVEEPAVHFNRVSDAGNLPDLTTGEALLITGTTNVGPENQLQVTIRNTTSGDLVTSQTIPVVGANSNQWTYSLDEPGLPAGKYNVTVGEQKYTTHGSASAQLTVREYLIAGNSTFIPQPELPAGVSTYGVLLRCLSAVPPLLSSASSCWSRYENKHQYPRAGLYLVIIRMHPVRDRRATGHLIKPDEELNKKELRDISSGCIHTGYALRWNAYHQGSVFVRPSQTTGCTLRTA